MLQERRVAGLSLAEIVIVMGILAVLIAVGIPFYIRWRTNQDLRNSGDRVLAAIRLTQSLASRFARDASEFEIPLAGGQSLQEALTGVASDPFTQCTTLSDIGNNADTGGAGEGGGTSGYTSGSSGASSGGSTSGTSSGGSTSGTSGGGSNNNGGGGSSTSGASATLCSIALKKSDDWTVYSKEYVDGGIIVTLTPSVSFTDVNVGEGAQSAITVGGAKGIAFLSNGTLYSRAQTQLQLTSSTGRTCVINITPSGSATMQQ